MLSNIQSAFLAIFLVSIPNVAAFRGDLTYYGGAGKKGSCSQSYVPNGFRTVAMNNAQYDSGKVCGSCIEGCFNKNGKKECFKAIVDNLCPECKHGDLDMGQWDDGRWPVDWKFIDCPRGELKFSTEGSNQWYGKIKVEGGGGVKEMKVDGKTCKSTPDGFWVVDDGSGKLGCGPKVQVSFQNGAWEERCLPGSLFGGSCSGGSSCKGGGSKPPPPPSVNTAEKKPVNTYNGGGGCSKGILHSDGVACCPKYCGQCGGANCSKLPGGPYECCSSNIIKYKNVSCANKEPPCVVKGGSSGGPSGGSSNGNVAGANCHNGIKHSDGKTCCPKSCGKCGGYDCEKRPGGASQCCSSSVKSQYNRSCKSNPAPCVM